jgi:hypothetical protein
MTKINADCLRLLPDRRSVLFIAFATPAAGVFFFRRDFELAQILSKQTPSA